MKKLLVFGALAVASSSFAVTITLDESNVSEGSTLANQYAGVTFAPGLGGATGIAVTGQGSTSFATNSDMMVTATDVGGGVASGAGRLLHSFDGWLNEDGDSVFHLSFANPIETFSARFHGISGSDAASSRIFAIDGSNAVVASAVASTSGGSVQTLSLTGLNVQKIVVTPGNFFDWVGVDDFMYTNAVPEPATVAFLALGVAALARKRRK